MWFIFLVAFAISVTFADNANARQTIPPDNLGYPVLIVLKNGSTGSGFFLHAGDVVYFVTAKHVLFSIDPATHQPKPTDTSVELTSYSPDPSDPTPCVEDVDLSVLNKDGKIKVHPQQDVVVFAIGSVVDKQLQFIPGVISKRTCARGVVAVGMDTVRKFDQALTGNDAIIYGYPRSIGLKESPQLDPLRPILRKGMIAGLDSTKRSIVLDGAVYPGNSGGPVFQIEEDFPVVHFYLIGVAVEFVPFDIRTQYSELWLNSGYSIAVPMDYVLELIE